MDRPWSGTLGGRKVVGSNVLASYWNLAAERQRVYHARLAGEPGPWTDDAIVSQYRFTNAYRAADRVSQDLIRVLYSGSQDPDDLLLRTYLETDEHHELSKAFAERRTPDADTFGH